MPEFVGVDERDQTEFWPIDFIKSEFGADDDLALRNILIGGGTV